MDILGIICGLIALLMWPFGMGYFMGYRHGAKRRAVRYSGIGNMGGLDGSISQDVG